MASTVKTRVSALNKDYPATNPSNMAMMLNEGMLAEVIYLMGEFKTDTGLYMLLQALNHPSCNVSATKLMLDLGKVEW